MDVPDDKHWAELLKRLDHWYSVRAIRYTPEIATAVVKGLEAALDRHDEATAEEFSDHIKAQFTYSGAQIGARSFYSSLFASTEVLVDALDTERMEAHYGPQVHNVSIRPFIDVMDRITTFVAVTDKLYSGRAIPDRHIDLAFSVTFNGPDGFLLFDREYTNARSEMLRVTLGENHPELRMLKKYDAPLKAARDTYHTAVFGDVPKLDVKIPVHTLISE